MIEFFRLWLPTIALILTLSSCAKLDLNIDVPSCIEKKIRKIQKDGVNNPPAQVWKWVANGKTYYYITSDCCDQYNYLYDNNCIQVCAPDGGDSGNGDGKCPNFNGSIEKTLVWEDIRK
jgi:hypothetical protein